MRRGSSMTGRLLIGLILVAIAVGGYFFGTRQEYNEVTQENQRIAYTVEQEIALGLQAAPEVAQQFGGLYPDEQVQAQIDTLGQRLVEQSQAGDTDYEFDFHVLADSETINAFALPGGQIFITAGLLNIMETEGEIAGVLAHEIVHVVGRHSSEQIAKAQLTEGLAGAAAAVLYDPENPESAGAAQLAVVAGQLITMKYGRDDELQSDRVGVRIMADAGYDPRSMASVMQKLGDASQGQRPPEFMSTHPNPENRIEQINQAIAEEFPDGIPDGLIAWILPRLFKQQTAA
jgi:predicted Zn-dependent protease